MNVLDILTQIDNATTILIAGGLAIECIGRYDILFWLMITNDNPDTDIDVSHTIISQILKGCFRYLAKNK